MCTQPKKILNPTKVYKPANTKLYLHVPCCNCPDCRARYSSEWSTRIAKDIQDNITGRGVSIFGTLTYNNDWLPKFFYKDKDFAETGKLSSFDCFRHDDIKYWIHNIRRFFERRGLSKCVRVVVTCEYGHGESYVRLKRNGKRERRQGTWRPHYHFILHFNSDAVSLLDNGYKEGIFDFRNFDENGNAIPLDRPISLHQVVTHLNRPAFVRDNSVPAPFDENGVINSGFEQPWKEFIEQFWPFGFVRWSRSRAKGGPGIFVESSFAAEYCSKYINKDLNFYSTPKVKAYLFDDQGNIINERKKFAAHVLPKHWQSNGTGIGLVDLVLQDPDKALESGLDSYAHGLRSDLKNTKQRVPVPQYIVKKVFYDYEDGRFVLNDLGKQVKSRGFDRKVQKLCDTLSQYFDEQSLLTNIHNVDYALEQVGKHYKLSIFVDNLNELLKGRSILELALYAIAFRGKLAYNQDCLDFVDSLAESADLYLATKDSYINGLFDDVQIYNDVGYFINLRDYYPEEFHQLLTYDYCFRFRNFNKILENIDEVNNIIADCRQRAFDRHRDETQVFKHSDLNSNILYEYDFA